MCLLLTSAPFFVSVFPASLVPRLGHGVGAAIGLWVRLCSQRLVMGCAAVPVRGLRVPPVSGADWMLAGDRRWRSPFMYVFLLIFSSTAPLRCVGCFAPRLSRHILDGGRSAVARARSPPCGYAIIVESSRSHTGVAMPPLAQGLWTVPYCLAGGRTAPLWPSVGRAFLVVSASPLPHRYFFFFGWRSECRTVRVPALTPTGALSCSPRCGRWRCCTVTAAASPPPAAAAAPYASPVQFPHVTPSGLGRAVLDRPPGRKRYQ